MDVGTITNVTNGIQNTYGTKETKHTDEATRSNVKGKTIGQPKLSDKAKEYYEELKSKYSNMEFILVSKDMKEAAKANASKYANPHKMVVLVDEEKIERMAVDEDYRKQYESIIASAQRQLPQLSQTLGTSSNVKGYGMQVNDNGTASFFAVVQKSLDSQADRIEKRREEKKAEEKAAEKKAEKKEKAEKLEEKRAEKNEYVTITANSIEELKKKVEEYTYSMMSDNVLTEAEKYTGTQIDYSV